MVVVAAASCVGRSVKVPAAQPNLTPGACPSPRGDRRTFTDASGGCLPAEVLAQYTCAGDPTPVMVRFAGRANERRYLGGAYRVPVERVPHGAVKIAVWSDRTQVFALRGDPEWLWVKDADGVMRWLEIPRRATWSALGPAPQSATPSAGGSATASIRPSPSVTPAADPPGAFFIGDSITDGASRYIPAALPGWTVGFDAVIGRGSVSGVGPAKAQATLGPPPDVLVVELGTNDQDVAAFRNDAKQILAATKGVPLVLWQTVHGSTPTRPGVNAAIRELVAAAPNAALADWNAFVTKDQMSSDGVHPASDHEDLMARLVAPLLQGWRGSVEGIGAAACIGRG
jgi:hypothetical protein